MSWDIVPECVSVVFLGIIWVYSRKGNLIPNLKSRLFQASLFTTFAAMTTNILSTLLIFWKVAELVPLTWIITTIYFVATPLMGLVYFLYAVANIYEGERHLTRCLLLMSIPSAVYGLIVITNPFTKLLFDISSTGDYTQGSFISATYIVFYIYCFSCVGFVVFQGKRVPHAVRVILFSFPAIAGLVIVIQLFYPSLMLSGSAATAAILIIYLYLQNKQMSIDYLTQLPNRHEFLNMLDSYIKRRYSFSIVVLSLSKFKETNDTYGQQSGDNLLEGVGEYLCRELRLQEGEIFRYSGDEFALLLRERNKEAVKTIVDKLLQRMSRAWDVTGCTCMLSASIGIVNYPKTSDELAGLINGLEYAVSQAKLDSASYNVCYCTPELYAASKRRSIIAEDLEKNLNGAGFELFYQPIFSVEKNCFIKAEALLRMPDTRLDGVYPDEFIPVAEESGLIIEITYLVLDKVCRFIKKLESEGVSLESVNVNFSALQFSQKDLIPRMLKIMERHGVPNSKIKIELTESVLAENMEIITACLYHMNEIGIRIGLDDFGTGYSNLISVLDLPIDTVKLDKSLVWSAEKNERCSIALQSFAHAFHDLGMVVLAEGVETETQRKMVVDAGCTLIQGFFYARPMNEAAFIEFIRTKQNTNTKAKAKAISNI